MAGPILVTTDNHSDEPAATRAADAPAGSMLAALRRRAASQRAVKHLDVAVGGDFGEDLLVRYGYLALEDMDRYGDLQPGQIRATSLTIDMLISACRTVLFRHQGQLVDLEVGLGGELWERLGWPLPAGITNARDIPAPDVVAELFARNGMALVTHAERVVSWMQDPADAGEASAATS